ncbi:MAG: hypothetical protein WDN04_06575 [Rhodospirillales bacterium]
MGVHRGTPDLALDADPKSGVWVLDTTPYYGSTLNWAIVGGTSAASPAAAALVNNAGTFNANSVAELAEIYSNFGNTADFTDVAKGACPNGRFAKATKGYDLCTGVGTPLGLVGK